MYPFLNTLSIIFLLLFFETHREYYVLIALILLIINTFFEKIAEYINNILTNLTQKVGNYISKLVLFFIYYLVLVPTSYFYKKSKENALYLKKPEKTLWLVRNKEFSKEDFEKPF